MAAVRARFHFRVRGLLIDRELLGNAVEIQRGTRLVTVSFPSRETIRSAASLLQPELFPQDDPAPTPTSASMRAITSTGGQGPVAQIDVIGVEVAAESPIGALDVRRIDIRTAGPDGQGRVSSLRELLDQLYEEASELATDLIERTRVEGAAALARHRW
jgi:hypothetical protein